MHFDGSDLRHRLVDGFNPISQGELINNLFVGLLKVDFPTFLPLGVRKSDFAAVLLAKIVEEVLVQARVLGVVGGHLAGNG